MAVRGDNSLFFTTGIDNSGLLKGKADAVNIIQSLGTSISKINPFAALAVGAVAAFTLIANEGYKMSKAFESAMAEVKTIANVSEGDFKKLEQNVFSIYKRLGTEPPDKLAKGLYEIIGAGFGAGDALDILEIASKSATAGVTETAVAADGLTTILNAFRLSSSDAQEVADIMFATVDRGKISFEELSSQIATVAPLAASSNISFQEVGAAISTLTKQGVPASVAMTQIRSAIISTNEVLGDGAFKTLSLQEGFQKMYESANGSQNELLKTAGRIEAVNAIIGIAGDNFKGASEDLDAMANSAGSVDRSFKTITSTNANQWEIFANRIKATTKGIGDAVLDMSSGVVKGLNSIFEENTSVVSGLVDHRKKINDLTFEYNDNNTSTERRNEILKELKEINPAIVSGLGKEGDEYVLLTSQLDAYIELLNTRIGLEKELSKIKELGVTKDAIKESYIDVETRAKDIVKNLYNSLKNGSLKLNDELTQQFNETLNKNFDNNVAKVKAIKKIIQSSDEGGIVNESILNAQLKNLPLSAAEKTVKRYEDQLKSTSDKISKEQDKINSKLITEIEIDKDKRKQVLELLKVYKDLDKVSKQIGVDVSLIDDAGIKNEVEKIKTTSVEIKNINSIKTDQYKKNKNILNEYLNSENELIKEAAEKRKAYFEFAPGGKVPDDDRTASEKFADNLKDKEDQYKHYNLALKNEDEEFAKKLKETYKLKEEDYIAYLRNLYKITQSDGSKALILETLDKQGTGINAKEKVVALDLPKAASIDLDFKIDITSINALNRQLAELERNLSKETDVLKRDKLKTLVQFKKEEIDIAKGVVSEIKKVEQNNYDFLGLLSLKRIIQKKKDAETELQIAKDKARKEAELSEKGEATLVTQNEIKQLEENLVGVSETFGDALSGVLGQVSSGLGDLGSIFSKFGDDDTAQLMNQLAGVASGAARIAAGDIIGGSLEVLKSALTVEVISDTSKFEAAIKELEKVSIQIQNNIKNTVGVDNAKSRLENIENIKQQQDANRDAYRAEEAARKTVKVLGAKVWSKGKGTNAEKLEELEAAAVNLEQELVEANEAYNELITGVARGTLSEGIFAGLEEGKTAIQSFADAFKDIVGKAVREAFKKQQLDPLSKKFAEEIGKLSDNEGGVADGVFDLTSEEIIGLKEKFGPLFDALQSQWDLLNQNIDDAGIGGQDTTQSGLSGAISTITEDTANVLSGTLNSIRIDIATGLDIAQRNTIYLSQIVTNTSYNKLLEKMDITLTNIDSKL